MKLILPVITFLFICIPSATFSQDKPELFLKLEATFKSKEPKWQVEKIYPPASSDPYDESIVLKSEQGQAAIQIRIWKKTEDAINTFDAESTVFDRTSGRMVKTDLPGFGDANHFWTNAGSEAWPTLKFRKGNIQVTVFGPSVKTVKEFAQDVLNLIGDTSR